MSSIDDERDDFFSKHFGSIDENGLEEKFEKYDKDGNGLIDEKELGDLIKDISNKKLTDDSLEEFKVVLLKKLDKNGDGKIDWNELKAILPTPTNFLAQFCQHRKQICGVDFIKIWNHYDVNSNGSLEGDELKNFLNDLILKSRPKSKPALTDEELKKKVNCLQHALLEKFKKKDTGSLSRNDLIELLQVEATSPNFEGKSSEEFESIFDKYDKEKSGNIDAAELAKLLADLLVLEGDGITEQDMTELSDMVLSKLDKNTDKIQKSELKKVLKIDE